MKTKTQHTPAPWPKAYVKGIFGSVLIQFRHADQDELQANAKVAEAAPDLLAVLEDLSDSISHAGDCPYRHHGECLCIRSRIVAAIAKAEGR